MIWAYHRFICLIKGHKFNTSGFIDSSGIFYEMCMRCGHIHNTNRIWLAYARDGTDRFTFDEFTDASNHIVKRREE